MKGWSLIEQRFGSWANALIKANLPHPATANKPTGFEWAQAVTEQQKVIYREKKAIKKQKARQRLQAQKEKQHPEPENNGDPIPPENPSPGDTLGGNGDTDDEGQGQPNPNKGPEDDSELRIVTNLYNGEITYDQLTDDVLPFYAYLINGNGMTLRVKLRNSATPLSGTYLSGEDKNYQAVLQRNETNFLTLYTKDGNTTVHEITYSLRYVAQMADEDHPTIGSNPPSIVTNLEGVEQLNNRNFTLTVKATDYTGNNLYSGHIEVRLDGNRIT